MLAASAGSRPEPRTCGTVLKETGCIPGRPRVNLCRTQRTVARRSMDTGSAQLGQSGSFPRDRTDGASQIAAVFDPVALEDRLRVAREQRAEALARREAAGKATPQPPVARPPARAAAPLPLEPVPSLPAPRRTAPPVARGRVRSPSVAHPLVALLAVGLTASFALSRGAPEAPPVDRLAVEAAAQVAPAEAVVAAAPAQPVEVPSPPAAPADPAPASAVPPHASAAHPQSARGAADAKVVEVAPIRAPIEIAPLPTTAAKAESDTEFTPAAGSSISSPLARAAASAASVGSEPAAPAAAARHAPRASSSTSPRARLRARSTPRSRPCGPAGSPMSPVSPPG